MCVGAEQEAGGGGGGEGGGDKWEEAWWGGVGGGGRWGREGGGLRAWVNLSGLFPLLPRKARAQSGGPIRIKTVTKTKQDQIVQELCESRGGRPGLSVLTSLLVSVDVKIY